MSVSSPSTSVFNCCHLTTSLTSLPGCLSNISKLTGFKRNSGFILHPLLTLLFLLTRFSPRPPRFSTRHYQPTRHPLVHARNVGVILVSFLFLTLALPIHSFSKSCPLHLWDSSQVCPRLSICLATSLFQAISAMNRSSHFCPSQSNKILKAFTGACHFHSKQSSRISHNF